MPPPTSSPHHSPPHHLAYPSARGPLKTPPSYSTPRESAVASPMSRHNNMSISSIMGSDSPATTRAQVWSPTTGSNGRSYPSQPMRSPRTHVLYGPVTNDSRIAGPSPVQYGPVEGAQPSSNTAPSSRHGPQGTPNHSPPEHYNTRMEYGPAPRPYSHSGLDSYEKGGKGKAPGSRNGNRSLYGRRNSNEDREHYVPNPMAAREQASGDTDQPSYGPRPSTRERPVYGPMPRPMSPSTRYGEEGGLQYGRWSPHRANEIREADRPIASREGPQLPPEELEGPIYGPFLPQDPRSYEQHMASMRGRAGLGYGERSTNQTDGLRNSMSDRSSSRAHLLDSHLRRSLEDSQMSHRAILGGSYDRHQRVERSSPLPQAVQGASSQPVGSGRDPTIKTEFGRMFSGLGSGIGSTPVPMPPASNGSPTPARSGQGMDVNGALERYSRSPGVERLKRPYDLERLDSEYGDGRMSPSITAARGGKRSKNNHSAPHHHHHPLGHQYVTNQQSHFVQPTDHIFSHHHRHPKADEDTPSVRRISGSPFTAFKFQPSLQSGPNTPTTPGLHRHHHHQPHHHHHHRNPAQAASTPVQPIRRPITTIKTNPLLEEIADRPRRHLGSQLYAPRVAPPPASTPSVTKFNFASKPRPLPLFEDKENCTFTVRIPRDFLTDKAREHVCSQKQVWGTDVYTDDSDVLAAAIHAGWIRGAWGEDVDVSMLELINSNANGDQKTNSETQEFPPDAPLTEPPTGGPVLPPVNRDAHITILILPALEKYSPSTWHGIRSRSWGDNHDGMSFKIHKIEWVDEGAETRWSERDAKSLSKRLTEKQKSAARCAVARPPTKFKAHAKTAVAA